MLIGQQLLLVSPVTALLRLGTLACTGSFWLSVTYSLLRICAGFLAACLLGVLLATLSSKYRLIEQFLAPFMITVKAVPVACFVILILIWVSSVNLSIIISFLMVLPIVYTNTKKGITACDVQLLEMAQVFRIPFPRRLRAIYLPQISPYFQAACSVSIGLCWKAGIAAEVIGLPRHSIGANLYNAKIYLDTPDLFAWSIAIICISLLCEKLFLWLLKIASTRLQRS